MFQEDQYQLLDFGEQFKLELFSGTSVCRQTPSAIGKPLQRSRWPHVELTYLLDQNKNRWSGNKPEPWLLDFGTAGIQFELRCTATGQVGVFPEQATNWNWILKNKEVVQGRKALNLFGYTGGTTLALAMAGAEVVHVDSAASVVKWARGNADRSGLSDSPIRWIVEDARRFVQREIKRGNRYDIVIADPPSFGRGPKGETWKLERDLEWLADELRQLQSEHPVMSIISCHTPGVDQQRLGKFCQSLSLESGRSELLTLTLPVDQERLNQDPSNRSSVRLESGVCFRWLKS
ncbi:MAG: class I SAM-dependent methyltransferase [Planctomycetota bacterium]